MNSEEMSQLWQQQSQDVANRIAEWRNDHPKATLAEIETAVDEQMHQVRARLIEEVAHARPSQRGQAEQTKKTMCPQCGTPMHARGKRQRSLETQGGQSLTLTRQYHSCPSCGYSFSPLDEELDVPPTGLLPHAHQTLVRLGAWMPFERVAGEMHAILGIQISDATVRRQILKVGAIFEQIQTEQSHPPRDHVRFPLPEEKPVERLAMGSDGGMVPLTGGKWAEVKTLVIGEVLALKPSPKGTPQARTTAHSYFSRMTDAQTFADLASAEISRRGVAKAQEVCAVQDGAQWLQGFVDGHRHDAVRILDFAHAAEYVGRIAEQATLGGSHLSRFWLPVILHQLKHAGPDRVIAHLERLEHRWSLPSIGEALRYFRTRRAQMNYPQFQAQGWPIGSGMVESANKVVMQARLKGAGMHWDPTNVNPMLAVRGVICNHRWEETWHQQQRWRSDARHVRRQQHSEQKRAQVLQQLKEQILRVLILLPQSIPDHTPPAPKGRTESQKRWGRQTFSRKALPETFAKK